MISCNLKYCVLGTLDSCFGSCLKPLFLYFQPPSYYIAMYDYEAQDDDEVGFLENDTILDTEEIDEGWMYGTVQRTGKRGMLPSNYVEKVQR